jgi:cysteine desulfurase/selenocysteine lyase
VTFTLEGHEPEQIRQALAQQQINVSVTTVFGTRLDMEERSLASMVRASVHYYNDEAEVGRLCEVIGGL